MKATPEWSWRQALRPGIEAVKAHWKPLVLIQIVAVAMAIAYYQVEAAREFAASLARIKSAGGFAFSFGAGFTAGGILPEIAKLATGKRPHSLREWLGSAAFNGLAYGLLGVSVDIFYQLQTTWFGASIDPATLTKKTLVDMLCFSTLWAMPGMMLMYDCRKGGWALGKQIFTLKGYRDRSLPALIPNWFFWVPVLLCVYSMPPELQFLFATLMEAAWSIVFVFIATRETT